MGRIAIVTPLYFNVFDVGFSTINIEHYVHGFRTLGHEAMLICPTGSRCHEDIPHRIEPLEQYTKTEFWRSVEANLIVFFNWLKHPRTIRAMQAAGKTVVTRADSAGDVSMRHFPRAWFAYLLAAAHTPEERLKALVHFLRCYFWLYREQDREFRQCIAASDRIAIETQTAKENLHFFLSHYGEQAAANKIIVCPHLIAEDVRTWPLPAKKQRKIVAIGRWDAVQKDAPLLEAALLYYLKRNPETAVTLIGKAGETAFARLRRVFPHVQCTGLLPRDEIKQAIADSRILTLSSRWETFHIAAHEALCLGCTVVGPQVIPLPDILGAGDFGRMVGQRNGTVLGEALLTEMQCWEKGQRDPAQIATFWRNRLDTSHILGTMIAGLVKADSLPRVQLP